MRGRAFLRAAHQVLAGANEPCWRGCVVHAYYALFLECRDTLASWGFRAPVRHQPHNWIRLKLQYASDAELKDPGHLLEELLRIRNLASYDLSSQSAFSSDTVAQQALTDADDALAMLDAIDINPVRRAAAIASLPR